MTIIVTIHSNIYKNICTRRNENALHCKYNTKITYAQQVCHVELRSNLNAA